MRDILRNIYQAIESNPELTEHEVKDIFVSEEFFTELGYKGFGVDIRAEKHIVERNRPDYFCKDEYGNTVFVIEFKKPSREESLAVHTGQLWDRYVVPLRSDWGILTDGREIIIYERKGTARRSERFRARLDRVSQEEVAIVDQLRKPSYKWRRSEELSDYFEGVEPVSVGSSVMGETIGRNDFLDTFRLESGAPIHGILERSFSLLEYYLSGAGGVGFPADAYEFWCQYYAPDEDDINWYDLPEAWRSVAGTAEDKLKIVFTVETVQSLLGRLMLAKACGDYDFPEISVDESFVDEVDSFRGTISPVSYVAALRNLLAEMREELVESVFEEDIYFWWESILEEYPERSSRQLYEADVPQEIEGFGIAVVELVAAIARFGFADVKGDPLGELYQRYFSPQIRRALGEFYTPRSVVDYLLDQCNYPEGGRPERLIDPSCGSGTFLVEALRRYKQSQGSQVAEERGWADALREINEEARIVGLDIHPFAVVMAQIRFLIELLPEYKAAVEEHHGFTLRRLPIFRTDSLINESERQEGKQLSLEARPDEIEFELPLPVRRGEEFEILEVVLPSWNAVSRRSQGVITNRREFFKAMLPVFDAVKQVGGREDRFSIDGEELATYCREYFPESEDAEIVASVFLNTASELLTTVETLKVEYNDGRLLKLIEDVVLSITLKNDIEYDYVVGNPPWVSKHSRLRGSEREYWMKSSYISAWNESDMYMLFVERGLQMLKKGGELAYIVSSRFLQTHGASELRALLAKNRIREIVDFRDYPVFKDATNYSALLSVQKAHDNDEWIDCVSDGRIVVEASARGARVRDWPEDDLDGLIDAIRRDGQETGVDVFELPVGELRERVELHGSRYSLRDSNKTFDIDGDTVTAQAKLPFCDMWCVIPPEEMDVVRTMEEAEMRLGDSVLIRNNSRREYESVVGDDIRVGIQTSGNKVYLTEPVADVDTQSIRSSEEIRVSPKGADKTYTLDSELLHLHIGAENVDRWWPDWSRQLVIVPYRLRGNSANIIDPYELSQSYKNTWEYFTDPAILRLTSQVSSERRRLLKELAGLLELSFVDPSRSTSEWSLSNGDFKRLSESVREMPQEVRDCGKRLWWYRYMRKQNVDLVEKKKILLADLTQLNKASLDSEGRMAPNNVSVWSIIPDRNVETVLAFLNSEAIEFYHKKFSPVFQGKSYRYIEFYTSRWPIPAISEAVRASMEDIVANLVGYCEVRARVRKFPDPYIIEAIDEGQEFETVGIEGGKGQESSANIVETRGGEFAVQVGREQLLSWRSNSRTKAEYVRRFCATRESAGDARLTVRVPHSEETARMALRRDDENRNKLERFNWEEHEARLNDLVYEAYGLKSDDTQKLIEASNREYLSKSEGDLFDH